MRHPASASSLLLVTALSGCGDSAATTDTSSGSTTTASSSATTTSTSTGDGGSTNSTTATTATGGAGGSGGAGGQGGAGGSSAGTGGAGGGASSGPFRVVAANLTSGTMQDYDPGHGIRILQGIHADVLLLQEVNYGLNDVAALRSLTDQVCGIECTMARGSGTLPNAVVSRFPILESGTIVDPSTTSRDFAWARIDVPGSADLYAFSVHLLTSGAPARDTEAIALSAQITALVPSASLLAIGGDLNTDVRDEAALITFSQHVVIGAPWPVDQAANDFTSQPRTKPYDWILADADLDALMVPVVLGANSFPAGLVLDTRVYTPLSDVSPAVMTDSAATGMQHMAVTKDYFVP